MKLFLKVKKKKKKGRLSYLCEGRNCWPGQLWVTWLIRAAVSPGGSDGGSGAAGPSLEKVSPPRASAAPSLASHHPVGRSSCYSDSIRNSRPLSQ